MLVELDAPAVVRWCARGMEALHSHRQELDDLNVYPVPDGDTGTNLVLTWQSVGESLQQAQGQDGTAKDLRCAVTAMAHGALMGARGNSGVILSQLLRGLAEVLAPLPVVRGGALAEALVRAADSAWAAVAAPVEGTLLSVARGAADAASAAEPADDLAAVVRAAARGAAEALAETPRQLAVLARAGVVDAGGRGLVLLLDALASVVTGDAGDVDGAAALPAPVVPRDHRAGLAEREGGSEAYGYEVQFLLETNPATEAADVAALGEALTALGDSLVVVGGAPASPGLWNVHVHVDDIGRALEAGIAAGRPHRIDVTRFADQIADRAGTLAVPVGRAVVAVVPGDGLAAQFRSAGVTVLAGGPGAAPSMGELLTAVDESGGCEVVLLPNEANVVAAAQQAATAARAADPRRTVVVVPTRSPVQGLAAVAVADPERPFADDVVAMTDAAGSCRWAEVTRAARDALTTVGEVAAGDVLGLVEGEVVHVGRDSVDVAAHLVGLMLLSGGELVTVVAGGGSAPDETGRLEEVLVAAHPTVEVVMVEGGQPHYPFLLGVE